MMTELVLDYSLMLIYKNVHGFFGTKVFLFDYTNYRAVVSTQMNSSVNYSTCMSHVVKSKSCSP